LLFASAAAVVCLFVVVVVWLLFVVVQVVVVAVPVVAVLPRQSLRESAFSRLCRVGKRSARTSPEVVPPVAVAVKRDEALLARVRCSTLRAVRGV
jgi:hypothetical protein